MPDPEAAAHEFMPRTLVVALGEAARLWSYYVSHSQLLVRWPGTLNTDLVLVAVGRVNLPVFLDHTTAYARAHGDRGLIIEFVDALGLEVGTVTCGNYRVDRNTKKIDDDGLTRASAFA